MIGSLSLLTTLFCFSRFEVARGENSPDGREINDGKLDAVLFDGLRDREINLVEMLHVNLAQC